MSPGNGRAEALERIRTRALNDDAYRELPATEAITKFIRDHAEDPDVLLYKDAEPSPPMDLGEAPEGGGEAEE